MARYSLFALKVLLNPTNLYVSDRCSVIFKMVNICKHRGGGGESYVFDLINPCHFLLPWGTFKGCSSNNSSSSWNY